MVVKEIMVHIFQHSKIVLPLSVKLNDYYGHSGVALSVPTGSIDEEDADLSQNAFFK